MRDCSLSLTSALDIGGWLTPRPGRFTPGKEDPVPTVQEAGWSPEPVWVSAKNLAPIGIPSAGHPNRSESLYRLSSSAVQPQLGNCNSPCNGIWPGNTEVPEETPVPASLCPLQAPHGLH